ncbi:MAG: hypothetical protein IJV00_06050 [Clostridia bacterium]|nr:hypothetical protein [Clostridia bacterium]
MKKLVCFFLALILSLAFFCGCAGNADSDGSESRSGSGVKKTKNAAVTDSAKTDDKGGAEKSGIAAFLEDAAIGDRFTFGAFEQDSNAANGAEPVSWIVIRRDVGKTLVISEKVIGYMPFKQGTDEEKYPRSLYKDSDLRAYLNGDFYNGAFSGAEKEAILLSKITTEYKDEQYNILQYDTEDKVFVLSRDEAARYVSGVGNIVFGVPTKSVEEANPYRIESVSGVDGIESAVPWWLRDMGSDSARCAGYIPASSEQRRTYDQAVYDSLGVRPAMWIVYNESDMNAYAKGEIGPKEDEALNSKIAALKVGDKFEFGVCDKNPYKMDGYEPLTWTVLDEDDESFLIISDAYVGKSVFAQKNESGFGPDETSWAESYLREYINSEKYSEYLFTPQEKAKFIATHVVSTGEDDRTGGAATDDLLFVPDAAEIEKYLGGSAGIGYKYWLRSQSSWAPYIAYADAKGFVYSSSPTEEMGIRLMARIKK